MRKRIQTRDTQSINRMSTSGLSLIGPDDLKIVVRDQFGSMTTADRVAFILALETELLSANLSMRSYLILLGISASSPEELTPSEVGHFVRFLKINVPSAMRAVDGVIERFSVSGEKLANSGERLAA
ncbi:MAG: hypothetical protein AABO41_21860 [Acidobacteriota bacterium]